MLAHIVTKTLSSEWLMFKLACAIQVVYQKSTQWQLLEITKGLSCCQGQPSNCSNCLHASTGSNDEIVWKIISDASRQQFQCVRFQQNVCTHCQLNIAGSYLSWSLSCIIFMLFALHACRKFWQLLLRRTAALFTLLAHQSLNYFKSFKAEQYHALESHRFHRADNWRIVVAKSNTKLPHRVLDKHAFSYGIKPA